MFPLIEYTLDKLKGAFPVGEGVSVDFNVENHPLITGTKAVTLRAPAIAVNQHRLGIIAIGATSEFSENVEERAVHLNITLATRLPTRNLQLKAMEELNDMLNVVRNVFHPPLCLAFLNPISCLQTTDDIRYGYMVGHKHEFHISNIAETEPGWWSHARMKSDRADMEYAPEGYKLDLSVGPFIQYIDTTVEI